MKEATSLDKKCHKRLKFLRGDTFIPFSSDPVASSAMPCARAAFQAVVNPEHERTSQRGHLMKITQSNIARS